MLAGRLQVLNPGVTTADPADKLLLKIYVAELPRKFNTDLVYLPLADGVCSDYRYSESMLGDPTGPLVDTSDPLGPRATPEAGINLYFHQQLLHSPLRVHEAADADVIFVPLYINQLVYEWSELGACSPELNSSARAQRMDEFSQEAPALLPLLGQKPHLLVLYQHELEHMDGCGGWGTSFLCNLLESGFVFGVPEVLTVNYTHEVWSGRTQMMSHVPVRNNTVAIPYFGHFHSPLAFRKRFSNTSAMLNSSKSHLATLSVGQGGQGMRGAPLRPKLIADCEAVGSPLCHFSPPTYGGTFDYDVLREYANSWFCIQPYGDSALRLGLFDCLALGESIPVLFDEHVPFMLAYADLIDYPKLLVVVPMDAAMVDGDNIIDKLGAMPLEERFARVQALQALAHVFQYAVHPAHLLVSFDKAGTIDQHDDAFTSSLKAVVRNLCAREKLSSEKCARVSAERL
jgi:hypothetical protein